MPSGYELAATVVTCVTSIRPLKTVSGHRERCVTSPILLSTSHLHVHHVARDQLIAALLLTVGGAQHNGRARKQALRLGTAGEGFT